jgi:hypothetical protein
MWQFLSFSGRWNPENLAHLPPVPNNIPTAEQMRKTKEAIQARATYRQAKALALHVEEKKKEAKRTTDLHVEEKRKKQRGLRIVFLSPSERTRR